MPSSAIVAAIQGSEDWQLVTAVPTTFEAGKVRAIKVTACTGTGAALTVTKSDGTSASTGELGLHVLEPMIAIQAITSLGDATEVRVYF